MAECGRYRPDWSWHHSSVMIDPNDAVMLLIDHQGGLFRVVKDISLPELRRHAIALAKVATLTKLPVITTASIPDGPNGPLIPEVKEAARMHNTCRVRTGKSMRGTPQTLSRRSKQPAGRR